MILFFRIVCFFLFKLFFSYVFLVLDTAPKSFGVQTQIAPPKIEIEVVCTESIVQENCIRRDDVKDNRDASIFPLLDENNTFTFNDEQLVFVGIQCVAPYPVEWVHFQEQWLTVTADNWLHLLKSESNFFMRTVKSLNDTSKFSYSSLLSLHNLQSDSTYAVGQYTCQSMSKLSDTTDTSIIPSKRASVQMTIYRQRKDYDQVFPLGGKNVTVWTEEGNDGTVVIPCYVSFPNVTVNLYKKVTQGLPLRNIVIHRKKLDFTQLQRSTFGKVNVDKENASETTWEIIYPNEQLSFRSSMGFIYRKSEGGETTNKFQLSPGMYKCTVADEAPDGFVLINLVQGHKPENSNEKSQATALDGKANFSYSTYPDSKSISIKCCSNSSVPPSLHLLSCFSKSACDRQIKYFSWLESNIHRINALSTIKDNCRNSVGIPYADSVPLNVKCIGEGVDVTKTFIFPVENENPQKLEPYFRWEDVDPYKMVKLIVLGWNKRSLDNEKVLVYKNQNVSLQCSTNTGYFAIGSRVTLELTDGKQHLLADDKSIEKNLQIKWGRPMYFLNIKVTVTSAIASISCHAALANSSKWIQKTVKLQVEDGQVAKVIGGSDVEEIYWTLNDTSNTLKCEFFSVPEPLVIEWRKNDQVIHFSHSTSYVNYKHIKLHSNASILLIHVATYETHGQYKCIVRNMFGKSSKMFHVFVRAPESGWIIMSTSVGLSCFIVAVFFLGMYTWQMRKHLARLKNYNFEHEDEF